MGREGGDPLSVSFCTGRTVMAHEHQNYPKWVYYRTSSGKAESRLIQTPDDLKKLPAGWAESPDAVGGGASRNETKPKRVTRTPRR